MESAHPWTILTGWMQRELLRPDAARAIRATLAIMGPLLLALSGHLPFEVAFTVIAAQSMAMIDVRGAYAVRAGFLGIMAMILAGSTWLGSAVAGHIPATVLGTAIIAINAGLWRHLTPEYGPSLAAPAALLYFVASFSPHHGAHAMSALVGSVWGLLVQMAFWPIRPQHPLRRAIAESWAASAALFAALADESDLNHPEARQQRIATREIALRETLERTYAQLGSGPGSRTGILPQLEQLQRMAARLATRLVALSFVLEKSDGQANVINAAPTSAAMESLAQCARSIALAVVSRQPAHLALCEVRLRRAGSLLRALLARVTSPQSPSSESQRRHAQIITDQVIAQLREIDGSLRGATQRADERGLFGLELLDLNTWRLRPLAAVLNLSPRPDPAIIRFTARVSVFLMLAVLLALIWHFPHRLAHAYWLPYTIIIVLQPDYGATRAKAAQRLWGTVMGSVLGTALLLLHLPLGAIVGATAAVGAIFAFYLRRKYAVAVVFITVFIVLLTESFHPATVELMIERLSCTFAGGLLALGGAMAFWPTWERTRFPAVLASAVRANGNYLQILFARLGALIGVPDAELSRAKRHAESMNQKTFGSLARIYADPISHREGAERAAVLANGNLRLMRALNLLLVQAGSNALSVEELSRLKPAVSEMAAALNELGTEIQTSLENGNGSPAVALPRLTPVDRSAAAQPLIWPLAQAQAEVGAMYAALHRRLEADRDC